MGIGKRIKEARENKGLTQKEFAQYIGVTPSAIANYESGLSHPKDTILYNMFSVLDVDANFLFQDELPQHKNQPLDIEKSNSIRSILSERLKKCRKEKNLSRDVVAIELGVSSSTIGNYEADIRKPDVDMIVKLAMFYGVTTDYLLGLSNKSLIVSQNVELDNYEAHINVSPRSKIADGEFTPKERALIRLLIQQSEGYQEFINTKKAPTKSEDSQPDIEFDDVMFLDEYGNRMIAPVTPEIKEIAMRALKEHAEEESKRASETTDDASSQ